MEDIRELEARKREYQEGEWVGWKVRGGRLETGKSEVILEDGGGEKGEVEIQEEVGLKLL